ncbi:MAG: pseudaminic acid synthase [Endomicrobiales bacterium]|nr:pseudaminic acid synthase [Endomicrobiales bacterium]
MKIANREIGGQAPAFIIAELSANHNHSFDFAKATIKAMKESGADAVKLQTYTPDTMTLDSNNDCFKINQETIWDGKTLYQLYKDAYMPWEWQPKLKDFAESIGLIFFSSPFDKTAVDFLEELNVPCYKIASFEITDIPLIEYVASKNKPIIFATGIAEIEDINLAIDTCKKCGNEDVVLLKCTSNYPTQPSEMNLITIPDMANKFGKIVGLSDHSLGITAPITAVALGAKVIEKHFILDKTIGGPDASFSLEPNEFKEMVRCVRETEKILGEVDYSLSDKIKKSRKLCKSIFVSKNIKKGDVLTEENIKVIRPGYGLHPKYYKEILGKKVVRNVEFGTPFSLDLVDIKGPNPLRLQK